MKKKLWFVALATIGMLSVLLMIMVACKKKEPPKTPTGVRSSVEGSTIRVTWNAVENAPYYMVMVTDVYNNMVYEEEVYATSWTDYSPNEGYNRYRVYAVNEYGMSSSYGFTSCYYHDDNGGGNGGGNGNNEGSVSVSTNSVTNITTSSAVCGGNVTVSGNATVTARGVCWSTSHNPTTAQSHTSDGQGAGSFTSNITGLSVNTQYYVRAYAQVASEIVYGSEKNFTTNNEQPPQSPTVTVTVINVSPTYLELKFEPSSNTAYYCYNIGGTLTSTIHQTGVNTKKYTRFQSQYFQPDTEYEFSVVAYDANGTIGEITHPRFKTSPAPYTNYYRVYDNFYQINYAKLVNEQGSNSNLRLKSIILFSEYNYLIRFDKVCYWYETDNDWSPGIYPLSNGYYVGECACYVMANGHRYDPSNGEFTISKNGNMMTYDLYGDDGSITAHFTGVPIY